MILMDKMSKIFSKSPEENLINFSKKISFKEYIIL